MQTVLTRVEGIATLLMVHQAVTGFLMAASICVAFSVILEKAAGNISANIARNSEELCKELEYFFTAFKLFN